MPEQKQGARPEIAKELRPFVFHGLDLSEADGDHPTCDCPFCGKEGKFSVTVGKGTWGCWTCGEKGNVYTFLRRLWDESDKATNGASKRFAAERGLLDPMTLNVWGVVQSVITGEWLVPGWNKDGKLTQLYQRLRVRTKDGKARWELRPTPTLPHAMHGVQLYDKAKPIVHLHESWGNALAFWEVLRQAKETDDGLKGTAAESSSLLASANVLAVANCGAVGESLKPFLPLFAGKEVVLWFDNDHPRVNPKTGKAVEGAGQLAARRATELMAGSVQFRPESVHWMPWPGGENLPSGFDVRDALSGPDLASRLPKLQGLLNSIAPVPAEWVPGRTAAAASSGRVKVEPLPCSSWKELLSVWRRAFRWRQGLEDVLAVMLAVCTSTSQKGNQLFVQIIGDAGSGKTEFCEGLLSSQTCYSLEQLTGFTSGWKDETGEDYSLLARINHKCLVTPEADVMMANPQYQQIMSQCRRIFDGSFVSLYKNRKSEIHYPDLRTPWIQVGTPALLDSDQARLGDRFLRLWVDQPADSERRLILLKSIFSEGEAMLETANGDGRGTANPQVMEARRMTGGYVDYLRRNAGELLAGVHFDDDRTVNQLADLAEYVALLRARPHPDKNKLETHDTKELPSRLGKQLRRLAGCLSVVMNKDAIDDDVMRIIKRVAVDTSRGLARDAAAQIQKVESGETAGNVAFQLGVSDERVRKILTFMRSIGAVTRDKVKRAGNVRTVWKLSKRLSELWGKVNAD